MPQPLPTWFGGALEEAQSRQLVAVQGEASVDFPPVPTDEAQVRPSSSVRQVIAQIADVDRDGLPDRIDLDTNEPGAVTNHPRSAARPGLLARSSPGLRLARRGAVVQRPRSRRTV